MVSESGGKLCAGHKKVLWKGIYYVANLNEMDVLKGSMELKS